jgi:uncharacterized protein YndB with AHSA1/START domain
MSPERGSALPIGIMQVEQAVTIAAPPRRVFEALTRDIAAWWGPPHIIDEKRGRDIVLEANWGAGSMRTGATGQGRCGPPSPASAQTSTLS